MKQLAQALARVQLAASVAGPLAPGAQRVVLNGPVCRLADVLADLVTEAEREMAAEQELEVEQEE